MLLEKLFLYLQGYLILSLQGFSKERFINLCKNKEIEIIQIFLINDIWYCKIKCRDYKKIRGFFRKTGCRFRINKKCGLPFLLKKIKLRKGLLIGSALFLFILSQCSGRIWHVSVEGGFLHTREQLLMVMQEELGIYGGIPSNMVDCFEIEKKLRLDYNEIGWISVEKRGCRLFVRLNESTMPKIAGTREEPSHIVAEQDGIVRKLEVRSGIPQVKEGDMVKKGDILISGIIPIVGDYDSLLRNEAIAADGAVWLESEFSYQSVFPITYEKKNYKESRLGIDFFCFDRKLFSYIPRYSDSKYDIMSIDVVPFAFDDFKAPVYFRKYRLLSYDTELIKLTEAEVKEKAGMQWNAFLSDWEAQGVQILQAQYSEEVKQKRCYVTGTITACGNFISYQKILDEEWIVEDEHSGNNP